MNTSLKNPPSLSIPEREGDDSDTILKPVDIVNKFAGQEESFSMYRFLQDMFIDYISYGGLEGSVESHRKDVCYKFSIISEIIFDLEKHNEDHEKGQCIMRYLQLVNKTSDPELNQVLQNINELTARYGSLTNGLDNLAASNAKNTREPAN